MTELVKSKADADAEQKAEAQEEPHGMSAEEAAAVRQMEGAA